MLAKVQTCAVVGLEGSIVEVEVDISPGLPSFTIVGLPDTAVQEARERVRAALRNSGCDFPMRRITVNLAPADLKKQGPSYDLPIAVGVLRSVGQVDADVSDAVFLGELALDGTLRHTDGILPMVALAQEAGFSTVYVPEMNAKEAALIERLNIVPLRSLTQLLAHLRGDSETPYYTSPAGELLTSRVTTSEIDLAHIRGQEHAKRALEVAAAGGHNLLMTGPPGSGKTLLARALPSILPPLTSAESLEVTKIYSVSGLLPADTPLIVARPFRSPHYTISHAGLVGGGRLPRPGEITLSHRGVLFLDELPEFGHNVLEVLRQPMEDKVVTISRAQGTVTFPANFMAGAQSRRNSSVLLGGRVGRIAAYRSACRRVPSRALCATGLKEARRLRRPRRSFRRCRGLYGAAAVEFAVRSPGPDRASSVAPPHGLPLSIDRPPTYRSPDLIRAEG